MLMAGRSLNRVQWLALALAGAAVWHGRRGLMAGREFAGLEADGGHAGRAGR